MSIRAKVMSAKVGALFEEYCSESSVHGVRFFVGNQRSACVKLTWLGVFILSLVGCGVMIQQAYNKWDRTPVIVTLSEVPTPVWDMTFPAVTICPEIKVLNTQYNYTREFETLQSEWYRNKGKQNRTYTVTEESIGKMKAIIHHCSGIYKNEKNFIFNFNHVPEPQLVDFLKNVSLGRRSVFTMCSSTSDARCTSYMQVTVTNEGICYSFNMISQQQMFHPEVLHNEYKYLDRWEDEALGGEGPAEPLLKVAGSGLDAAIGFNLIHYPLKIDTSCVRGRGYKVLIHEPTVYPDLSKRNIRLSVSQTLTVVLKPNIMMTAPELSRYSAQKRQCYFAHEHPLQFFRHYNQDNCELECLTNYTLRRCGCVHFSMPHANGTRVCKLEEAHCPADARGVLFIRKQHRNGTEDYLQQCDCLPACSSVRYDLQITQDSHTEEREVRTSIETEVELQARLQLPVYSVLQVYYQDTHFIPAQRSELHGLVDFLANCGGLLGLFIGVSLLSIVEAIYYIVVRPISFRKRKTDNGEGNEIC
ncbi:pickpocket protein 28-like [Anopheles moucheti]|uniref:pickpocket protein 28-like n=1 Tax=Anopheles moucheti TaxID=186751 RepID=UPI0022F01280|nr:pickpocket protein 28-like [Anopheles moucheti]